MGTTLRILGVAALAVLLTTSAARGDDDESPEALVVRLLAAEPVELAEALARHARLDAAAQQRVRDLLHQAEHHPDVFADRLIDRALATGGEEERRILRALHRLGTPALARLLVRTEGAPKRILGTTPSPTETTEEPSAAPSLEGRPLIQIECRVLRADAATWEAVLGPARPSSAEPNRLLDDAQARKVLARVGEGMEVLHAPKLTAFSGQAANVSITNEVSYVRDYEVHEDDEGNVTLDPVVDSIQDGLVVDLEPSIDSDGIRLDVRATLADLARPIAEFQFEHEGVTAKVQVPELRVSRTRTSVVLPTGGYVLLGGLSTVDGKERMLLLKADRVEVTPR